jgi:ubiquinone/menaquinone biosynthesis C-methylase UbiE
MTSLLKPPLLEWPILDFGAGTGWVSEFCARMRFQTVAFDIHGDLRACLENRVQADCRIDERLLSFAHGDGHAMPFEAGIFGHVLCYDTLHHMHDYPRVFSEFFRVLRRGGRGIFVEPGARHSSSPETVAFVASQKKHDPTWIERDVVLEEINEIALDVGFKAGLSVVPMPHPAALQTFSMEEWASFRQGDKLQRLRITDHLASINYFDRVIFCVDKPE